MEEQCCKLKYVITANKTVTTTYKPQEFSHNLSSKKNLINTNHGVNRRTFIAVKLFG